MRQRIAVTLLAVAVGLMSWTAYTQPTSVAVEVITASGLTLHPRIEWERARIVVGGPEGHRIEKWYSAPEPILFTGLDKSGSPLADGFYRYEVSFYDGPEQFRVHRGHLIVESGQIAPSALGEERGPRPELGVDAAGGGGPIDPRDFADTGSIKAGVGLVAGSTTGTPSTGELQLVAFGGEGPASMIRSQNGLGLTSIDGFFGAFLWLGDDFNAGINTFLPEAKLHVLGGPGGNVAIVEGGALAVQRFDGVSANIRFAASGQTWLFQNQPTDGTFNIRDQTGSVTPVRVFPGGIGATLVVRNGRLGLRNTAPQHPIHAFNGARLTSGGTWANASSRDSKQDIESLSTEEALTTLEGLDPVKFAYKVDATDRHVGFIAEDVPELVASPDRKALAAMDIVAVLTRVVQEQELRDKRQQQLIEQQQAQIAELRELVLAAQAGTGGAQ